MPDVVPKEPTTNQSETEPDKPDDLENIAIFFSLYTRPTSQPVFVPFL